MPINSPQNRPNRQDTAKIAPDSYESFMVVNYSFSGASFKAEPPRPWPGARYYARSLLAGRSRDFDLSPDGNRLALATAGPAPPFGRRFPINVFLNFFDELRRVAPQH